MDKVNLNSEAEFKKKLDNLIVQACQNGVEVNNQSHVLRHSSEKVPDMEVSFHSLAENSNKTE